MGDPKKLRKKYIPPRHPWDKSSIESERKIITQYGLVKKEEIHRVNSFLKKYKDIAKRLIATRMLPQSQKEKAQVLSKLQQLGMLPAGAELDQILGLELKDALDRRLQSIVFRKGLARSVEQARQFIVHRHVTVSGQEISSPSYLVSLQQEGTIGFKQNSSLSDAEHPERVLLQKPAKQASKEEKGREKVAETPQRKEEAKA